MNLLPTLNQWGGEGRLDAITATARTAAHTTAVWSLAWLFSKQNPVNPMTARQLGHATPAAAQSARVAKHLSPAVKRRAIHSLAEINALAERLETERVS